MKKLLFPFVAISIISASVAFAEDPTPSTSIGTNYVPTTNYVETGLKAVYRRAKEADAAIQTDLNNLSIYVGAPSVEGTPATGLTKKLEDLTTEVTETYYRGDNRGVLVTDDKKVVIPNLDASTATNDKVYVFRNNMASQLEIAETWHVDE